MDIISKLEHYKQQSQKKRNVKLTDTIKGLPNLSVGITGTAGSLGSTGKYSIENLIEGHVCKDLEGSCYIIENKYPLSYLYGCCSLGDALNINYSSLKRLCPDITIHNEDDKRLPLSKFLFLDTETTGLSGGVGTVPFLIGIGFFKEDVFVLRQYFMRDYDEEITMLNALNKLLEFYNGLVTFNGKAFDWNLINTRYIFNRIRLVAKDINHIDLLFPSRRIWKGKLESCALSSLEKNILKEYRVNDIPGALIPSVYFKYVVDKDAREIRRVIEHNKQDILSMVSLIHKISGMMDEPLTKAECGFELLGLGKMFESGSEISSAIKCFEKCTDLPNQFLREEALMRLSKIYKKSKDYEKAARHWEIMIPNKEVPSLFPLVELAKYYEHKVKDIPKAIEMTNRAIAIVAKLGGLDRGLDGNDKLGKGLGTTTDKTLLGLRKRLERLKRKNSFYVPS